MKDTANLWAPQPLLVEVIGPAGAGKSTLVALLQQQGEKVQPILSLKGGRFATQYTRSAAAVLPVLVHCRRSGVHLSWQDTRWMLRLAASREVVQHQIGNETRVVLIDQGPVYTLARLLDNRRRGLSNPAFDGWWQSMLRRWAHRLDMVVWLDAPSQVLLQRVGERSKWHITKTQSGPEAMRWLSHQRRLYSEVIEMMQEFRTVCVAHFDSGQCSPEAIAEQLLPWFSLVEE